jgi:hypothetical protein
MKQIVIIAIVLLSCLGNLHGQLVGVINEEFYTDDGSLAGYPAGFTTYRIYALTQDPTDFVATVSSGNFCGYPLFLGSSLEAPAVWNYCDGGPLGSSLDPNACDSPSLECYDSFLTIGYAPGFGAIGSIQSFGIPADDYGNGFFCEGESSLAVDYGEADGGWYVLPGDAGGVPQPPDNRVLIAQITVPTGTLEYCLNIAVYDEGVVNTFYVHDLSTYNSEFCELEIDIVDGSSLGLCNAPLTIIEGCMDYLACNYDPTAEWDNNVCTYPGCMDSAACNYDSTAGCENGSCEYPELEGDFNCDGVIGMGDLLTFITNFGCSEDCDLYDINGDGVVNILDLLMLMGNI